MPTITKSTATEPRIISEIDSLPHSKGVTWRTCLLSVILAALLGTLVPIIDLKLQNTYLGSVHLPPGAIGVLLALLLVINPLLRLLSTKLAFTRNEILTVYVTSIFSCIVPGHGAEPFFVSTLIGPFYFATRENQWLSFLEPNLKPWMSPALWADGGKYGPQGHSVVEGWYVGISGHIPWAAWIVPLLAWTLLILAVYTMLACLSVMLRGQWAGREALSFPLLKLPLEMTEQEEPSLRRDGPVLLRNPLMWIGFAIAAFCGLENGLHVYFPDVPALPLSLNLANYFVETPWNQIMPLGLTVMFLIVGISFLLVNDVSFSLWFFVWFIQAQLVFSYLIGFPPSILPQSVGSTADGVARTFVAYQQIGCYYMYVTLLLWTARAHLGHIAKRAFGRAAITEEERSEALSYPVAFWGFVGAFGVIWAWSVAAGIRIDIAFYLWTAYLVIAIALTRVVAESGLFCVQHGWSPLGAVAQIAGSGNGGWLASSSIVPASFLQGGLMTDLRGFLMPSFLQAFKLSYDRKINSRALLGLITVCILIALSLGLYWRVRLGYDSSGLTLNGWFAQGGAQQPANNSQSLMNGAPNTGWHNLGWLGMGMAITFAIVLARSRFAWFPLHPLGLLLCLSAPSQRLWFSVFLGWMLRSLVMRFGGFDSYKKVVPIALGLVLGDVAQMLFWLVIDGFTGRVGHNLMPG